MHQTITRKIFGQAISYQLNIEESSTRKHYEIRVACLQPKLLEQMLGNSPLLLKNQLLAVVKDAAYNLTPGVEFQEPLYISSTENAAFLQARISSR